METLKTMTGPIYIEGAKPGDALKVDVLDASLPLDYAWIGATQGAGTAGRQDPGVS